MTSAGTRTVADGLTPGQLASFREQGYLQYGPLLTADELSELREIVDGLYADENHGPFDLATGEGTYTLFTPVFTKSQRYADLLHRHPILLDVIESILGPVFRLVEDQVFFKPARHGAPLALHHDNIYYGFTEPKIVTCWIALDDATPENGCLQILSGSHCTEIEHRNVPGTIIQEAVIDPTQLVEVQAKARDLVIIDGLTVHGSGTNTTDFPRRVANLVAIAPCEDGIHRKFNEADNPYLRGAP